ncbi:hypothetical protein BMS3Abin03_00858 [bacterium BMS3Abin03]|nr:hypothetical protein BMS3Abin03_00858 [bacterium BMS3Abin03]
MYKQITFAVFFLFLLNLITFGQPISSPIVIEPINHDTSIPLRDMEEAPLTPTIWQDGIIPVNTIQGNNGSYQPDHSLQVVEGTSGISTIGANFDGVGAQGYAPPDVSGDVGPNHYMQMVNIRFQIWDKNGTTLYGPVSLGTLWQGFPGPWQSSINDGDPVVLYDDLADRWVATQFSLPNGGNGPEYILVAVSQTPDPTGSWYRYGFETAEFPDYPKFGVWNDGYYFTANRFGGGYTGTYAGVLERDKMLTGDVANMVLFAVSPSISWSLLPVDCDGTIAPPSGSPGYFMQAHDNAFFGGQDGIDIFELAVDWANPSASTFTGPLFISTSPFSQVNGIPQQGTGTQLDDLSDRPMQRLQYRNFGTHGSMVVCQTVNAGSGRAGMRWYELRNSGGGWTLYQEGTYAPADGLYRWMGSIAMNANGDIALGYSVSSSSMYPEIRYTGRSDGDPLGQMTVPEDIIKASSGAQTGLSRWGDYTTMSADPDGQSFWYTNEYLPYTGSFHWKTRIASLTFGPPCPVNASFDPNPADGSLNVSINLPEVNWTNGSGATQVEVWFGESGSLSNVYDGAVINSWSITNTLDYNTSYGWKIIGKNDTCSISSPVWTFTTEHNPNNQVLFADDFDSYTAGQQVACQNPVDWTTWNYNPCDAVTDPYVSTVVSYNGSNSVKIASDNDLVYDIGLLTSGKYSMAFQIYIPSGSLGYWNTLQEFAGSGSIWGLEVYYNASGVGSVNAGVTGAASFTYSYDTWIPNEVIVDLDADLAQLFINGSLIYEWQWSLGSNGGGVNQLGANDFYADNTMMYYFDDYIVSDLSIVPVELTSFTAMDNNGEIELKWTTATELNNQMFEIQRRNEDNQFATIGYVEGNGTSANPHNYTYIDNANISGTLYYRLKQVDFGGMYTYSDEVKIEASGVLTFELEQNYPNPFNPSTLIAYSIPQEGFVSLNIYNLLGEKVATLVNSIQEAGRYEVSFDASSLASGIYVYSLKSGSSLTSRKMLLMK